MKASWIAVVALAGAIAVGGCGGETKNDDTDSEGRPARSQSAVTIAVNDQVPPLDPQQRDNQYLRVVTDNIFESLLWRNAEGELEPLLAAEMPERVDATTWRFKLREGISFTNGEPMDAEAAAFSINRIVDKDFASEYAGLIETIEGAEARGDLEVDVTTHEPDELLPARMALIKILPPKHSQTPAFPAEPIGTGPYVWVSGEGNDPIVLERAPEPYWGTEIGRPEASIAKVTIQAISDVSTRLSALQAGDVDLLTNLPPDAAENVPKVASVVGNQNPMITLNTAEGVTRDVRVRRAINLAVDRQALADELFQGYAEVARCQNVSPVSEGYNEELEPYPYDPEQARQLIEEAGATGAKVDFVATDFHTNGREMAQAVGAFLTEAGLEVDVRIPEFNAFLDELYAKGASRPEMVFNTTSTELDASSAMRQLASDGIQSGYDNPDVDRHFQEALQTEDVDARNELYREALQVACDDAALLTLLHLEDVYGMAEDLDWEPRPDGGVYFAEMSLTG